MPQALKVQIAHIFYFIDIYSCRLPPTEIDEQVKERKILPSLKSRPDEFHDRMLKYVYPSLEGTHHGQLIFYYTLLQGCGDQDKISPETHLRLLKKIKPAAPGMFHQIFPISIQTVYSKKELVLVIISANTLLLVLQSFGHSCFQYLVVTNCRHFLNLLFSVSVRSIC